MKRLSSLFAMLLLCVSVLCVFTGCGDSEFKKAAKQATTVKYISVNEDLHLVSNYIDERDLKSDGLDEDAYFLYGTADTIYFAVTSSDTSKSSTVYSYDIETREISTLFSRSGSGRQGSDELYLFYVAMAKEDSVSCFYSRVERKVFGGDKFYIRVDNCDLKGNVLSSEERAAERVYAQFSNNRSIRDMALMDFLAGKADRYWERRTVSLSGPISRWGYTFHGVGGSYPIDDMTSSDAMWNFIHSQRGGHAQINVYDTICYQPYGKNAVFGIKYMDNSADYHYVYFAYEEGGEPQYLFSGGEDPIPAIYVV